MLSREKSVSHTSIIADSIVLLICQGLPRGLCDLAHYSVTALCFLFLFQVRENVSLVNLVARYSQGTQFYPCFLVTIYPRLTCTINQHFQFLFPYVTTCINTPTSMQSLYHMYPLLISIGKPFYSD